MKAGYGKAGKQKTLSNFPTATTTTNYNYLWDTDSEGKVIPQDKSEGIVCYFSIAVLPERERDRIGRANGGIPRKRGIHLPTLANLRTNMLSHPGVNTHNKCWRAERLRLMEEENARLRQVVINLTMDLERWRSIAQSTNRL